MKPLSFRPGRVFPALALALALQPGWAGADTSYGIAMYGAPALPQNFVSLPYANPDAPKGGTLVMGDVGGFDSLNPFIIKGRAPYWLSPLTVESLMGRSYDEPFTLYGLLAESITTPPDRSWVEFTLNPKARFSDGKPVTVADVIWSFKTVGTEGDERYRTAWRQVSGIEQTGPRSLKITFKIKDRELPLLMALRPVLEKAQWAGKDFTATSMTPPIGSGPYVVDKVDPGREITFKKNPDWWGKDLPFNRGQWNFNEIKDEYFGDGNVAFQAFKAGLLNIYREGNPAKWANSYDFPAVRSGDVVKSEIPSQRPSGMAGFVMNTRKPLFSDWRVRQAMIDAFNFKFVNRTLNGGALPRITSYYSNSYLGMDHGPAKGRVLADLEPFKASLFPGAIGGYSLPNSDGTEANRRNLRAAMHLLSEAGWNADNQGVLRNAKGEAFDFELLLPQGDADMVSAAQIYASALKRLGMTMHITSVDSAQYVQRTLKYDFDMTNYTLALSLSPGNEQTLYWGSEGAKTPGTRNLMGADQPAIDALIAKMVSSTSQEDFTAAAKALDRVLMAGRYVVPIWYRRSSYLAHAKTLHYPNKLPIYGDWPGFMPNVWWYKG
ncbi:extracellular solute-binding protein [Solirhodobacter olei]|uniref:extracellular solute-binding protein n=1 Tax=Solirhodobacter olei TaxID=2493082 RepID=UPI001F4E47A2|nr:extracellular solute-binding protein [Solirhodobacter olei]